MIKAVFFDMNETLLSLELLNNKFMKLFKDEYALKYWFTSLLHTSTIIASMDEYVNFAQLAKAELDSLIQESGQYITQDVKNSILNSFKYLAPHGDVIEAVKTLKHKGIKVIVVSNSSIQMMGEQLTNAGIIDLFDDYYSVDSVNKYKPFKDIYGFVAEQQKVKPENIMMVATHGWDLFGAKKAGLQTGYVKRKNIIFNPYYPQPDIEGDNLLELVNKIMKLNGFDL